MFRAVPLVNTSEMKKPSEEGFGSAVHQCERISFNALSLTLGQSSQTGVPTQTISSNDNMVIPKAV
jgi:hypothetical protein